MIIEHAGVLYVTAMSHKKCSKGTHWNGRKNKCMTLPASVARASGRARRSSAIAERSTTRAHSKRRMSTHHKAMDHHSAAGQAHRQAAGVAKKHGFGGLAKAHGTRARYHKQRVVDHNQWGAQMGATGRY